MYGKILAAIPTTKEILVTYTAALGDLDVHLLTDIFIKSDNFSYIIVKFVNVYFNFSMILNFDD